MNLSFSFLASYNFISDCKVNWQSNSTNQKYIAIWVDIGFVFFFKLAMSIIQILRLVSNCMLLFKSSWLKSWWILGCVSNEIVSIIVVISKYCLQSIQHFYNMNLIISFIFIQIKNILNCPHLKYISIWINRFYFFVSM